MHATKLTTRLTLGCLLCLTGCATAPLAQKCPAPVQLTGRLDLEQEPPFTARMADFLQGKLPEQKPSETNSGAAMQLLTQGKPPVRLGQPTKE